MKGYKMDYSKYKQNPTIYADVNKAYYKLMKQYGLFGFSQAQLAREAGWSASTCKKYLDETFADYSNDICDRTRPSVDEIYKSLEAECPGSFPETQSGTYYIYEIYHVDRIKFPNKHYVGRTNDILRRMDKEHFNPLYWSHAPAKLLYWNMAQDGAANYAYRILEICSTEQAAKQREEYWINQLHTMAINGGFNERHELSA